MLLRLLPLIAGFVPLIAVFGALWIGVSNEVLPPCFPVFDGCFSISAAGRRPPGSFLFRAVMMPQSMLLLILWFFVVLWLRSLDPALHRSTRTAILVSGFIGSLALILYVTFLGTREPFYEVMRRSGVYFAFLGNGVAQIITAVVFRRISRSLQAPAATLAANILYGHWVIALALGFLNVVLKRVIEDSDATENRIEWIVFVVMQSYFVALYYAWRITGFNASVSTRLP
jgi:low temperature requirement protein LtrA